jgi:uncharacterized membrane protein
MELHKRTIFKTLSWRVLATSTTLLLVYAFTQNVVTSAGVSITEILVKTAIYYFHERMWNKSNFGRKESKPVDLIPPSFNTIPIMKTIENQESN